MVESNDGRPDEDPAAAGHADAARAAVAAFRDLATSLDLLDQVAAANLGIARSDLRCLDVLARRGAVTAGALAKAVGLSAPALSAALRRLEAVGYVRREHDPTDRRTVRVRVTDAATAATMQQFGQVREATTRVLARLSPGDLSVVTGVATALADEIQRIASDP
jgi:DNA-binding MarR family transcriptional regulator